MREKIKNHFFEYVVCAVAGISFGLTCALFIRVFEINLPKALSAVFSCAISILFAVLFYKAVFGKNYILTKEQIKKSAYKKIYFFPGLVLTILWQVFFLAAFERLTEFKYIFLVFTVLIQLNACFFVYGMSLGMKDRIENIIDKQYNLELLNFMQVIRSQRHDFNFHIQTICSMIESGRYAECMAYSEKMREIVKNTNDILPLYNPAVSALINSFSEMALQKGIEIETEIHDNLQFIGSDVYETNTIIGNLLQNAVDEIDCHPEIKNRTIKLLIIKRGENNIIKVSNECHVLPDEMKDMFTPGFTTKKSHEGVGLANALKIAEKCGGTVYPEFEELTIHFIAKIPMKTKNT